MKYLFDYLIYDIIQNRTDKILKYWGNNRMIILNKKTYNEKKDILNDIEDRMIKVDEVVETKCDEVFLNLEKALIENDKIDIKFLLEECIFFEVIHDFIIDDLVNTFYFTKLKKEFMLELKKSYIKRGKKGIRFAWTPIINSYNSYK